MHIMNPKHLAVHLLSDITENAKSDRKRHVPVKVVVVPLLQVQNLRDPGRPVAQPGVVEAGLFQAGVEGFQGSAVERPRVPGLGGDVLEGGVHVLPADAAAVFGAG